MAKSESATLGFELSKCNGKREFYFSQLHSIYELSKHPSQRDAFTSRLSDLAEIKREIFNLTDLINDLNFKLDPNYLPDYEVLTTVEELIQNIKKKDIQFKNSSSAEPPAHFKVPKIPLPEFSGNIAEWPLFYEKFLHIIHNNPSMDNFAKLHYLLSCLKGKALEVCAGITPDSSNYEVILNALKARYENKRFLADSFFRKMLDLKPLSQESASGLSHVMIQFDTAFKSLRQLKIPDLAEYMAATILLSKLDPQTRREFEKSDHSQIPTYPELITFLQKQIEATSQVTARSSKSLSQIFLVQNQTHPQRCPFCSADHQAFKCELLTKLNTKERLQLVNNKSLCENCLGGKHLTKLCKSLNRCRICQETHHTLLHVDSPSDQPPLEENNFYLVDTVQGRNPPTVTLLATVMVILETPHGPRRARFLLDSCSHSNYISAQYCREFQIPFRKNVSRFTGLNGMTDSAVGVASFTVYSRYETKLQFTIQAHVVNKITNRLPTARVSTGQLDYLKPCFLADDEYFLPGPVDGVLGADIYRRVIRARKVEISPHLPTALETSFGYVIMGTAPLEESPERCDVPDEVFLTLPDDSLLRAVSKFWEVEEIPSAPVASKEDQICEELFSQTTTRNPDGRFCVSLPFREFPPNLGNSFETAKKRFLSLERRFKKSPNFHRQYSEVMQDYLNQGHLSLEQEQNMQGNFSYFLPHFAVMKESSSTPLRIVFDASAKTANSRSLNDALFTGPKLQRDINDILLKFRSSSIALITDIRQMYRNIEVSPKHRSFQKILWRFSENDPLQTYSLNCVVFGLTSAPYLALRTVQQLATEERERYPLAAALASTGMYVDDLVVSLESSDLAVQAYHQLDNLFRAGGFKLTKWATNSAKVLEHIPPEDRLSSRFTFHDSSDINETIKILGLNWDAVSDTFLFTFQSPPKSFTKRGVLSTIARIWDPLGFLAPVTFYAKYFMKELWMAKIDWDEELPKNLLQKWSIFSDELAHLSYLRIPRYYGKSDEVCQTSLIGFSDSSEKGYGAVVYLRIKRKDQISVSLLCAKSKVAPMKTCSLPRLELCAALILARLMAFCRAALVEKISITHSYAFTDSMVTLCWIKGEPWRWKTFVSNRVSKIQTCLDLGSWFHIQSNENIADCLSRGLTPRQLLLNDSWLKGPSWLSQDPSVWPITSQPSCENTVEAKDCLPTVLTVTECLPQADTWLEQYFKRFSSYKKLLRVTVYLLRFIRRSSRKKEIDCKDIEEAEKTLVRAVQHLHFRELLKLLNSKKTPNDRLRFLSPFLDQGVLRVGGRLANSSLPIHTKHPFLLPKNSTLSVLLIDYIHQSNLHAGPSLVLSLLRQRYWIVTARNLVRHRVRSCNVCFKTNPLPFSPEMAQLPSARVSEVKPFLHCGVDYAGPFQITIARRRGSKSQKAYLCLFVCLSTKALHLELASDLTTDTFLNCFKRFLACRGFVKYMYSDRGTNFVGARAKLNEIHSFLQADDFQQSLQSYLTDQKIIWKFIPPAAPHFGGIWERNIRSVKTHLSKVIGLQILSYEELYTILTQIEAILNSRPLCALSDDPNEPEVLTPAHFLTLSPLQTLPATPTNPDRINLGQRKRLLDSIIRAFWKRWHLEYLTTLQEKQKWSVPSKPITEKTLVIIKQENLPPLKWPLGVVEKVHPGADGVIRVATVRSGSNFYTRPVVKLCPLPSQ